MAAGKPTVVVATEAFAKLVKVSLAARKIPEALAVVMKGNPEMLDAALLAALADRVLDEAVVRLTGGAGVTGELVR